jgi:type IV pilus assembly protein PilE
MRNPVPCRNRSSSGFSLIELMVAVGILAIVAALAYPSYQNSVRKGRRAEGFAALAAIQQAQERWRSNRTSYASTADFPSSLTTSPNSLYTIAINGAAESGYEAIATAQGSQSGETACKLLAVKVQGGNFSYGSGQSAVDYSDPGKCWVR